MRKVIINGGKPLNGDIIISGAKNAALPILAATILLEGKTTLTNIPLLNDVITMMRVLRSLGLRVEYCEPNTMNVWINSKIRHVAPYELVTKMRASFFIIGPMVSKMGLARVPLPGGCAIGFRPVNYYLKGLETLGAKIEMEHGFVKAQANKLKGAPIYLDFPSVGATESLMMAATLAEGETIIENAAQEPEIVDLANFLNKCGAKISGAGTQTISITGVQSLKAVDYKIIPDRIEAGTMMVAAAITNGNLLIKNFIPEHVSAVIVKLQESGVNFDIGKNEARVWADKRLKSVNIKTMPYPGFPTDMQPQLTSLLSVAEGTSVITESIFENRFMHVQELKRMGADIQIEGHSIIIEGIPRLSAAPVRTSDLRAGAALILAALNADGETLIDDMDRYIDRGYEKIVQKLSQVGADIKEIK